jgi:hypothetical protein
MSNQSPFPSYPSSSLNRKDIIGYLSEQKKEVGRFIKEIMKINLLYELPKIKKFLLSTTWMFLITNGVCFSVTL